MTEKQIILSKEEYDQMDHELKELRTIIQSRKISAIVRSSGWVGPTHAIQYIHGIEENDALKVLNDKIKEQDKEIQEYKNKLYKNEQIFMSLNTKVEPVKQKPWYKKIF